MSSPPRRRWSFLRPLPALVGCYRFLVARAVKFCYDRAAAIVVTRPERTLEQIKAAYAEIPPLHYDPPADRWQCLSCTAGILATGQPELRVVMLGDSIIKDTSRACWEGLLAERYPQTRITKIACVRANTGCWWYKTPARVRRYVLGHKPDLLIIGGNSESGDLDSIRSVVAQVCAESPCDVLLMTGAFGQVDPRDDRQWQFASPADSPRYQAQLKRLAAELQAGFLDMNAQWGRYIRESGQELDWFKRDQFHANERGEQVLGHILLQHLSPPVI